MGVKDDSGLYCCLGFMLLIECYYLELAENTLEVFEAHKENSDKFKQNYLEVDLLTIQLSQSI